MNTLLLLGAILAAFVAVAHSYLGERYILMRLLRRENLPKLFGGDQFTKRTLRFAWHVTSVAWLGFAAQLGLAARPEAASPESLLRAVALTFAASSLVSLVGGRGRHLSWLIFAAIAVLAWLGGR
jgi:hypothetical protein